MNSLNSVGCTFHVDKPTRVSSNSSTCIDHVYSNFDTTRLDNRIILSDVSDHFGIITKICGNTKWEREKPFYYRRTNLSELEWGQFNEELKHTLSREFSDASLHNDSDVESFDHTSLLLYSDINEAAQKFTM